MGQAWFKIKVNSNKLNSPQSHNKPTKRVRRERKHLNRKFYTSKSWIETRRSYMREYQQKIYNEVTRGYWTVSGTPFELSPHQQTYILSLPNPVCELCLKLFVVKAYKTIEEGKELDHIVPLNPDNALESDGYGDPFDHNNLQLLCRRHHSKKSQRETNKYNTT